MIYFTAHCLGATPFPTLPLEVLALSGLETSKVNSLQTYLSYFHFVISDSTRYEKSHGF